MNTPLLPRLVLLLLAGLPVAGRAADWQSLVGNSPFGAAAPTTTAATGELEFRGAVQEDGVYLVNLYNPTTKTSQWVPVNGKAAGLEVKAYDVMADKVQITQSGRALTLPMKQAKVALVAAAAVPAGGPGANGEGGANGPGGDDESRRNQIRDMIRARLQGGPNGEPSPMMRNLPPEAQAMIEEYRRRRAEGGGGNGGNGNGNGGNGGNVEQGEQAQGVQIRQAQRQGGGQRRERPQN